MSLNINSFNSNTITTLFSSLNNPRRSNPFATGLESVIGDYTSLKSGSYGKLLTAYYSKIDASDNKKAVTNKDESLLNQIKKDADSLSEATDVLLSKKSDSIWEKTPQKDEDGNEVKDYDKNTIYNSLSKFVDGYNKLVDSAQKSNSTGVLTQVAGMVNMTSNSLPTLSKVGISVGSNNHLSIDEDFFKNKADISIAKGLFNGTGSYGYSVATKASMTNSYVSAELSKIKGSRVYSNSGNYILNSGDVISSFNKTT